MLDDWPLNRLPDRSLMIAVFAALLSSTAPQAQTNASKFVGIHRAKPGLVHPLIAAELPKEARRIRNFDLKLHESVPLEVDLARGKRFGELRVKTQPKIGKSKVITPGLINVKLRYGRKQVRPFRMELYYDRDSYLCVRIHTGSLLKLRGYEITFVDLDHDGAVAGAHDGYVVKPPKQQQWHDPRGRILVHDIGKPVDLDGVPHWLQIDHGGFEVIVSTKRPDRSVERAKDYADALVLLNEMRAELGFQSVAINPMLSRACELHSLYCASIDKLVHAEDKQHPAYTKEGALAGPRSEIVRATSMREAVRCWNGTFYHRIAMLRPGLSAVGMGRIQGFATMDTHSGRRRRRHEPFAWPRDGAKDVDVTWAIGEFPNPFGGESLDAEEALSLGYPVSLTFSHSDVRDISARLLQNNKPVRVRITTPEQPGNERFPDNFQSILIVGESVLDSGTTYDVEIRATVANRPFERRWSFTTRKNR